MTNDDFARGLVKTSIGYMSFTAIFGIVLGIVMLMYPGGTLELMEAAFMIFQVILSVFIIYYTFTEAAFYFKSHKKFMGFIYGLIGVVATLLIWLFDVTFIYFIIAFFLILTGIADIVGGFRFARRGKYLLILLGVLNILIAAIILRNPIILPLLIAWYVLFWGISRLFLSLELRKLVK